MNWMDLLRGHEALAALLILVGLALLGLYVEFVEHMQLQQMTDIELAVMQHELRRAGDTEALDEVLLELRRREQLFHGAKETRHGPDQPAGR